MKKLALALCTLSFTAIFAQKVSDYQYISLPEKFEGFKDSNYGLDKALIKTLNAKKYVVLPANRNDWPSAANQNPCNILLADVVNDSGMLRNKVLVRFKDCNNKVIATQKGASSIKEFEEGFQDALKQALTAVPASSPTKDLAITPQSDTGISVSSTLSPPKAPENSSEKDVRQEKAGSGGAQIFSNQGVKFQKIKLSNQQFILADQSSTPYATFTLTTKEDVFRVKLQSGKMTIGYMENENIVIEIPISENDFGKSIFRKD